MEQGEYQNQGSPEQNKGERINPSGRGSQIKPFIAGAQPIEVVDETTEIPEETGKRKIVPATSSELEAIMGEFDKFMEKAAGWKLLTDYHKSYKIENAGNYAKYWLIQDFIAFLPQYEYVDPDGFNFFGVFLNPLIKKLPERKVELKLKDLNTALPRPLGYLGYDLGWKILDIEGDVGDNLGYENSGRIILNGNAGDYAGIGMKGGLIEISGNVGDSLGHMMEDGEIILNGHAGDYVGNLMSNGIIRINGRHKSVSRRKGGSIYDKNGKIVFGR